MNYFAHGRELLSQPYRLAGTAIPDWLNVVDRKVRVRRRQAEVFLQLEDWQTAQLAAGIVQHHDDDQWFHATAAFALTCAELIQLLRSALPADDSMRIGFLGHILVEILLDASLIEDHPAALDDYYQAMRQVDPIVVEQVVARMSAKSVPALPSWIHRFCDVQFLRDYTDDEKLTMRLNQIMMRVRLPRLPDHVRQVLPQARQIVGQRKCELLSPPPTTPQPNQREELTLCNLE